MGGQDWDGPHLVVGRLVLGHTVRSEFGGWGRQVIIRTSPGGESAGYWVRPQPLLPFLSLWAKGVACTTGTADGPNRARIFSSTGVPPPDRCVPHQPHHPSQPDMRYLATGGRTPLRPNRSRPNRGRQLRDGPAIARRSPPQAKGGPPQHRGRGIRGSCGW